MFDAIPDHGLSALNGRHTEIEANDWVEVFQQISKLRYRWNVKVEVISNDFGSQILIDGLPLNGMTFEKKESI